MLLVALLLVLPATAFTTLPPGSSPHDQITAEAAGPIGFQDQGLQALQQAVRRPDLDETTVKASGSRVLVLDASPSYQPSHHCDRAPPNTPAEAFAATAGFVQQQREEARQFAVSGHPDRAVRALGYALHAIQDCYSHSDIVDHDAATRHAFNLALLSSGPPPAGIQICAFQPGAPIAEMPEGDPYPHGLYNKDSENSTDDAGTMLPEGQTKYFAAKGMAINASATFLTSFMQGLTPDQRAAILAVSPTPLGANFLLLPEVNLLAILGAGIVGFAISLIWFAPFAFGKTWSRLLGNPQQEAAKWHWKNIILTLVVTMLSAYLLDYFVQFAGAVTWLAGAEVGVLAWLAFLALLELPRANVQRAPLLYVLDMGQRLVVLAVMGAILGIWG